MSKIRFIFLSVFIAFSVFTVVSEEVSELQYSLELEELIDDEDIGFSSSEHEVENEVGYIKNSRRTSSNSNESVPQKAFCQFFQCQLLTLREKNKSVYNSKICLYQSEEISFLHRFQLF